MDLLEFGKYVQSPLWYQANDYIINKRGEAPNLEPLVQQLSFDRQCDVAKVLHNLLLVGFCSEHTSRVKRTFEVLEHLYQSSNLVTVCSQTPPTQFRWGMWMTQAQQRKNANKTCPPTLEPGVGAFLLTYAHCIPPVLKGTLNAMAEEDGMPLQWGRSFGMPAHIDAWDEKNLRMKFPDLNDRIERWNTRIERDVLLQEIVENNTVERNSPEIHRARKM